MQQLLSPFPGSDLKENSMLTAHKTDGKSCEYRGTQSVEIIRSYLAGVIFPAVYLNDICNSYFN